VIDEMRMWHSVIPVGGYMIVEDSNVNGHPVRPDFGPGPMEAINEFLSENSDFEIDLSRQKFYMTQNPRGYLKRIK
jgi:cephalosporin hydroxylase